MSKRGVVGTGQARKSGGSLGKKKGGGLYFDTYVYWTYMRVPTPLGVDHHDHILYQTNV